MKDSHRLGLAPGDAREPAAEETQVLRALLEKHRATFAADAKAADAVSIVGYRPPPEGIPRSELAAWTSVARTILNLHETITRE